MQSRASRSLRSSTLLCLLCSKQGCNGVKWSEGEENRFSARAAACTRGNAGLWISETPVTHFDPSFSNVCGALHAYRTVTPVSVFELWPWGAENRPVWPRRASVKAARRWCDVSWGVPRAVWLTPHVIHSHLRQMGVNQRSRLTNNTLNHSIFKSLLNVTKHKKKVISDWLTASLHWLE